MPLVRFELKNEYGLGDPRLYQGAPKEEADPRNILGGVTVSGLVGILRQLGDLAELAAVVFHDVHQQVMTTAARGHKVLNRIQKIETTLPQFEKAVQGQRSHIHFAYIAGCDWHANIQICQSQPFFSDLPEFMLDSYEECRDPPRLHLLDKFDSTGSGACLKRYSDPSYFRMLMASSDSVMVEKANSGMKAQRKKKQRSRGMHGFARHSINMTLRGRSSMLIGSLVTDGPSFLVDDASISDTLSIPGFTTELTYFSSEKRPGCIEVQNSSSLMSKEMHDGLLGPDVETTKKVDYIFNNDNNKVTFSDYVMQDSLHQQNDPFSSSSSCDEKTEMVKAVSQMLCHDIPVDGLNPKAAELICSLSSRNHLTDGNGTKGKHISRSLPGDENVSDIQGSCVKTVTTLSSSVSKENSTGNPEICNKCVYSTHSAASNEKAEIIKSSSSKFPDGIILCRPPDPDLLSVTIETSNWRNEMDDTEMHDQENVLPDTIKMEVPSTNRDQISELTSQLDKHMDATYALDSKVQTNFEYHTGQEMMLLPHLNYNGMECEISRSLAVTNPSLDCVDSEIAHEASTSLKKNFSLQVLFDHLQSSGSAEYENMLLSSVGNSVSGSLTYDCTMKNDSERINSAACLGVIVPITQAVVIDRIPPKESLSQDSFDDTSAKTAKEKEVLCEHQTKQRTESMISSNCQGTEYQISMEKGIAAVNFDGSNSETHVASCGSSDTNASSLLCGLIFSNNVDSASSSAISSDVTTSRSPINISSPRNDFEDPCGIVSAHLTELPVIISSDVTAATTVVSQVFPVDSFRKSSINIWTNGGLLGLEPSKPPDISVPNANSSDDNYDDRSAANSQQRMLAIGNESRKLYFEADKLNLISFPQKDVIMGKISDEQSDSMLSKQCPKGSIQASSFCKFEKAQNAYFNGTGSEIDGVQGKEGDIISSEADIYTKNDVSKKKNISMSVGFSSLAHRFLVSSLQRKSPMIGIAPLYELMNHDVHKLRGTKIHIKDNERTKVAVSSAPLHKLGNKEDSAHGSSEKPVSLSFDSSGYQSPPLEHMKFSFQPMNDSDVPNLNLEFLSSQQQGNMGNTIFPSFQPPLDVVSESDDDTFCRSCPYSSDDLLTLHSESDAEIWGEDEVSIPYRIEATGSISNFIEFKDCDACRVSQVNEVAHLKHGSE